MKHSLYFRNSHLHTNNGCANYKSFLSTQEESRPLIQSIVQIIESIKVFWKLSLLDDVKKLIWLEGDSNVLPIFNIVILYIQVLAIFKTKF